LSPRSALASLAVLVGACLSGPAPVAAAPVGDCQAGPWPAAFPQVAADVVARVNAHRAGRGLAPLAVSPTLTAAAEWKARHMAQYGYMEHNDPAPPVQRSPFERMQACGYPERALAGENIAAGYDSAASVMAGWLGSPGHRANIERPEFQAIGVGGGGGGRRWSCRRRRRQRWVRRSGPPGRCGSAAAGGCARVRWRAGSRCRGARSSCARGFVSAARPSPQAPRARNGPVGCAC
jgi:uncharacterized protein YkwD